MHLFTIPALLCPFHTTLHDDKLRIDSHTRQFLLKFSLTDGEQYLHYCSQNFATMIARSYPYGDFEDLAAWCDMNSLLFLLDDDLDETSKMGKEDLIAFEAQFMEILLTKGEPVFQPTNPLLKGLADIWKRMCARSDNWFQQRIIQGFRDMFRGGWWQFEKLSNQQLPSLKEYCEIRQFLGAANLATDSLPLTAQLHLPLAMYDHPEIVRLTEYARNAICYSNDLFSLSKEMDKSNQATFNLVTILQREHGISIQDAIHATVEMHDDIIRAFLLLEKEIYNIEPSLNDQLKKFVSGLKHLMKGNIVWSTYETTRYPHLSEQEEGLYLAIAG
ncbi:hypothetical protein HHL16_15520 [Pseudoflavitalea sp. G-6-1-2]|uniref:terpene synthase family protein n=1 Tax=Pseudoflavitalea sp. G-6-1-2 TaxID=2728841 RepID=UPI00146CBE13|nr:hypothetical protein [Pseudoflavitalea sp. G-6-1-2]NML22293.1 hypothetical protein [Pseudoflavitalea sp. G-6-1-2]